jgi:hypothetical protein
LFAGLLKHIHFAELSLAYPYYVIVMSLRNKERLP